MLPSLLFSLLCLILQRVSTSASSASSINRHAIVSRYNPIRNASSTSTPMQVGNGNFAFGADITGLQTFHPFAIMSSWGWKNDSLPSGVTMDDVLNWHGTELDTHGREVEYGFTMGNDPPGQWLISNPNRVNLGRIGLAFLDTSGQARTDLSEDDLTHKSQTLDLWSGVITSRFNFNGETVTVQTSCSHESDTIAVKISSPLLVQGKLGVFFDFPWHDGLQKFEAPFVGSFNNESLHTTKVTQNRSSSTEISHTLGQSTFFTAISWQGNAQLSRDEPDKHRYTLKPKSGNILEISASYSLKSGVNIPNFPAVISSSTKWWKSYWSSGGFVDLITGTNSPAAEELQRRVILSQYLMAVNEAGNTPPQESGLVNNGWYGKFHLEMTFWHLAHWSLWSKQNLINNATSTYSRFLPSSIERARNQGYSAGARWGKMSDPTGRSAPGEINNLLIWQQPHPLVFAELDYRNSETEDEKKAVLEKWNEIIENTADFMAAYAWWNTSTKVFDLGPPMFPVSENTNPLVTINPTFELAYWRLGLSLASQWFTRQGMQPKSSWINVQQNLAPLPKDELGRYVLYEGLTSTSMWSNPTFTTDHPALLGICGWIPPIPGVVDIPTLQATAEQVSKTWAISDSYGWDFPLLAMTSARALRNGTQAVGWLLHPLFEFDDVGMPVGGTRVPTPYFPSSGGLLYAVAMMAGGWDSDNGGRSAPGFPQDWKVRTEGLRKAL